MIPVFLEYPEGREELGFPEFNARFLEICQEHRDSDRALAFAMLLYDFRVPEIAKVLADEDYWRALHHLSGKSLTIFSVHLPRPRSGPPHKEYRWMLSAPASGDPGEKTALILRSYFGLEGRLNLPAVIFFQVHGGEVIDYHLWQLETGGVEAAFNQLRDVISLAVRAVEGARGDNPDDSPSIFAQLTRDLKTRHLKIRVFQGVKSLKNVADAASLISMVV